MRIVRRILWAVLFVALLIVGWNFRIANDITVRFDYLVGSSEAQPLWKVVLGAFFAGGLIASVPLLWMLARSGLLARRYRKARAEPLDTSGSRHLESKLRMRSRPAPNPGALGVCSAAYSPSTSSTR